MTYLKFSVVLGIIFSCLCFSAEARSADDPQDLLDAIDLIVEARGQFHAVLKRQQKLDVLLHKDVLLVELRELRDVYDSLDPIIPRLIQADRGRALVFKGYIAMWMHLRTVFEKKHFHVNAPPDSLIEEGIKYAVRGKKLLEKYGDQDSLPWAEDVLRKLESWHE